jgi:hypothetical protein
VEDTIHTIILILHVFGATCIIGGAFVTFIIEVKKIASKQVLELVEYIWKIVGIAFGVQLITGLYLAGSEWNKISPLPYFWIKMVLFLGIGGMVGFINQRHLKAIKQGKEKPGEGTKWALLGLLTFLIITALGVVIAENAA